MDPIGADDEIVVATRSFAELDGDDAVALYQALHGQPHPDRHVARRVAQQRVQVGAMDREARPDGGPELCDIDVAEQPPAVITEALARDPDRVGGDLRLQAEGAQRPSRVAR